MKQKTKYYELPSQGKEILQDEKPKESPKENKCDYLPEQGDDVLVERLKDPNYQEKQQQSRDL
jgi:hypothetical protein